VGGLWVLKNSLNYQGMNRSVFLDYDGVIVDSLDNIISIWNQQSKGFGNGIHVDKNFVRSNATGAWRIFYTEKLGVPEEKLALSSEFFKKMIEAQELAKLFTGMKEAIQDLAQHYSLYILSSNSSSTIRQNLKNYGLIKYFKGIAGDEEVGGVNKTEAQFVLKPLNQWGINVADVMYVGDTSDEVIGGKVSGIKTVGCS
jgi:HAD superfamily hydrolase (TIGR01549 family)